MGELAERVSAIRADLFFVRIARDSADGTIPLRQASGLIDSIEKMMKAAAIVTANPLAKGTGRTSERVRNFLDDDLRMGHTKRGSFIITIAARLHDDDIGHGADDPGAPEREGPAAANRVTRREGRADEPTIDFSRRVMTTLSRSLAVTRRHLDHSDDFVEFEEARESGMTAPIVEAIEEIATDSGGARVDMRFSWTSALPHEGLSEEPVIFTPTAIERAPRVIERFARSAGVPANTDVVGPVIGLSRDTRAAGEEEGDVIIQADVRGSVKKVGVTLSGNDYNWAIYAHRHRLPFTVSGILGKKSGRWWLLDDVEVDASFLIARQHDRIERLGGDAPEDPAAPVDV
ncbi:hypothetical protein [Luteimicrobium xylanilyticum]|nr:hypothetical protein [Luteimicrobium xylanilyticum]